MSDSNANTTEEKLIIVRHPVHAHARNGPHYLKIQDQEFVWIDSEDFLNWAEAKKEATIFRLLDAVIIMMLFRMVNHKTEFSTETVS